MKIQFPANPILFGTDAELSCYRPFAENMKDVSYFAWRNRLTADYLANGNRSMNESKYEPAMIHTESGINYTLRIKMFDHNDFNMLYECNIGFLKSHVNLSACNTTFIYLPKNEDITSHNVRNDDQETMVIEMKRVHPKPVCKLYIKPVIRGKRRGSRDSGSTTTFRELSAPEEQLRGCWS
ncbi:unnamed protein product [Mytilus coruscus]|uniref:Ig-like domain-containing protein n=1 Tax=Mytilus coruscus TaxID=42192 RepID=A0A6J7ZWA0_MYTCO|nr:unnamed protein product [Mytilus coruscus]